MGRSCPRRGVALIVVLSIILALMLIATPYLVSMLAHERSSQAYLMEERALLNADNARAAAITYLYLTGEEAERRLARAGIVGGMASYEYDLPTELAPLLGSGLPEVVLPPDQLAGASVADEQGKINLRTAPGGLVDTVTRRAAQSGARLLDLATIHSGRDAAWIAPQKIRAADSTGITVDAQGIFGSGGWLRISKPGLPTLRVQAEGPDPTTGRLRLRPAVAEGYQDGEAALEARHPVNILTASDEVLESLFLGLARPPDFRIDDREALLIAQTVRSAQPTSFEAFAAAVSSLTAVGLPQEEVDLVLAAAINPLDASISGGTVPICFSSYDVFSIDAAGGVLTGPGQQASVRTLREVVRLSPPRPTEWVLESQYDLQRFLGSGGGFPFGNRMITGPGPSYAPVSSLAKADLDKVELRMVHAQDQRGNAAFREHYAGEPDGYVMKEGEVLTVPWGDLFVPDQQAFDVQGGGIEMWIRFGEPVPPVTRIFDIRESDVSNRLSLEYNQGQLILTACDAGLPSVRLAGVQLGAAVSRVVHPVEIKPKTWIHVGAYWKSSKPGHLALLVDGHGAPKARHELIDQNGRMLATHLAGGASAAGTSIALGSPAVLSATGRTALEIGREVVEYDALTGVYTRGARGTLAADHPPGARAAVLGYSQRFDAPSLPGPLSGITLDRLTTGQARLAAAFGTSVGANLETGAIGIGTLRADFAPTQTTFQIDYPVPGDFPADGLLAIVRGNILTGNIETEVVKYAATSGGAGIATFSGITRAQLGTQLPTNPTQTHPQGALVYLISLKVDSTAQYLDPCIVQIDDEWFVVRKHPTEPAYFVSLRVGPYFMPLLRATFRTNAAAHALTKQVIPVFGTRGNDWNRVGDFLAGKDDTVTILDSAFNRRVRRIHHTATEARIKLNLVISGVSIFQMDQLVQINGQLAAFDDWVDVEYRVADREARLLKFPSGELMSARWLQAGGPQISMAALAERVDEIKYFQFPRVASWVMLPASHQDETMALNLVTGMLPQGGLVKVGDELIGYANLEIAGTPPLQAGMMRRCVRGFLDAPAAGHSLERAMYLGNALPVAALTAPLTEDADVIPVSQPLAANPEGYVLIGDEVAGYTGMTSTSLTMARTYAGKGLYRGRFGTSAAPHAMGSLVVAIPFRHYDTYREGEFDDSMTWYGAGTTRPEAQWLNFRFEAGEPEGPKEAQPRLHARVKVGERAEWHGAAKDAAGLFDFTEPGKEHSLKGLRGDTLHFRIFVEYPVGSYYPADLWKRQVTVKKISAGYVGTTRTLSHEE